MSSPPRSGSRSRGSTDFVSVAAIQGLGAAFRFGFQVALARVLLPTSFADVAVALAWTQVIAAALGGGAGAYLLTSLPELIARDDASAAARYRQTVALSVVSSSLVALVVALVLRAGGAAGASWLGVAVLATTGLRAALIATQESSRALGALAASQLLTMVVQPALAVAVLGVAAWAFGVPVEPSVAAAALGLSLAAAWAGQHAVTWRRMPVATLGVEALRDPVDWRALLRLGAASAMLTWMVEGTLVLASLVIDDRAEVARYAAHVRLSVVTSIAAITVSTVASTQWTRRVRRGGAVPSLGEALRWSTAGAGAAALAGVVLLGFADRIMELFGEAYTFSPAILAGLVLKDVAVAAASPIFYFLVMRGRPAAAVRASFAGAVALLAVPIGASWGGLSGASTAAAVAGVVWLGAYVAEAFRAAR